MNASCLTVDRSLQALQALGFHVFGDLIVHLGAGVPGRGEYLNEKAAGKSDFVDQAQRVGEIFFRLAGKADDEIGCQRQIGPRIAQAGA